MRYSITSKAYRVFNKRTLTIEESIHVVFDESDPQEPRKATCNDDDVTVILEKLNLEDKQEWEMNKESTELKVELQKEELPLSENSQENEEKEDL